MQVRKGDDFKLREDGVPEECIQRHDHRQPGIAFIDQNQRKRQQRAERTKANNQQPPPGVVTQPAPDIGRDTAHQHGDSDKFADSGTGKTQVMQVKRHEGRHRAEQGEITHVEPGQPPVRQLPVGR